MTRGERVYRGTTRLLAIMTCGLGIVLVASALVGGGGVLSLGVLVGACFIVLGIGRWWMARPRV